MLKVLNEALEHSEHLAGDYSIADIATYPWVEAAWLPLQATFREQAASLQHLARWRETISSRRAVSRGMSVPEA